MLRIEYQQSNSYPVRECPSRPQRTRFVRISHIPVSHHQLYVIPLTFFPLVCWRSSQLTHILFYTLFHFTSNLFSTLHDWFVAFPYSRRDCQSTTEPLKFLLLLTNDFASIIVCSSRFSLWRSTGGSQVGRRCKGTWHRLT